MKYRGTLSDPDGGYYVFHDKALTYTANINSQSTWLSFNTPITHLLRHPVSFILSVLNVTDIGSWSTITVTATDLNDSKAGKNLTVSLYTVGEPNPESR